MIKNHCRKIIPFLMLVTVSAYSQESYSPNVGKPYPTDVYWGDTHLHTNLSMDANKHGNKRVGPDDAYRFAKGEKITAQNGMEVQLKRPLDFLVIADHALNMGVMHSLQTADSVLMGTKSGRRLYEKYKAFQAGTNKESIADSIWNKKHVDEKEYAQSIWQRVVANAEKHNQPGMFTAFIGYEWTSWGSVFHTQSELHRVVIFKDDANKTNEIVPFSSFDSSNPEDLWQFLEGYEQKTGGDVLAIPHNGNLGNGGMFNLLDSAGQPLTQEYAKSRSRWEPLFEVTQIKGDSETHPALSPTDEFADYETWLSWRDRATPDVKLDVVQKQSEYARSALKLGLDQQAKLGVNPFKFGMIGSTDSHTGMSTADENNFWGKVSDSEPSPGRIAKPLLKPVLNGETAASGYAAVWSSDNTRDALFDAMERKEVYASTGPRIKVRFFGGWDYKTDDALKPNLANIGYSKGVPMGGDLTNAPKGKAPNFLIRAVKDPDGANLDRVQVIKGWHDKNGELHEKVYNVALSDGRKENWKGKVKPVGNTVDVKNASYTNSIGDPELAVVWADPDFNQDELAFYYVRVLEIPTPRWTAYDAKFFNLKNIPKEVPMVTQERAYTSPIWYTPSL